MSSCIVRFGAQTLFNGLGRWTVDIFGKSTAEMTGLRTCMLLQTRLQTHTTSGKEVGGWASSIHYAAFKDARCDSDFVNHANRSMPFLIYLLIETHTVRRQVNGETLFFLK